MNDSVLDESQMQSSSKDALSLSTTKDASSLSITKDSSKTDLEKPRKVKDFTVLANLVELATNCIPKCDKYW